MKKQLLGTSAIALGIAMAAPASAQEWDLGLGGYFNTHFGYVDGSGFAGDYDGSNIVTDGEIHFKPSVTLDNGLTFGATVEFEAQNGGGGSDGIDESYLTISGDTLGQFIIGSENSAGYKSMVGAPAVGSFAIMSASVSGFAPINHAFRTASGTPNTEVAGVNDVQRFTYFTPNFNGFVAGVSYAPSGDLNTQSGPVDYDGLGIRNIFDLGVNYSASLGTADVTVGARWGTGEDNVNNADPETWGIGAQVGFNGFTFGGHYAENKADLATGFGDEQGWSLGATYDVAGPWSVGLTGFFGERDILGVDEEYNAYKLAGSRELGAGVSWDVWAVYAENKNYNGLAGTDVDATMIGSSINLSF